MKSSGSVERAIQVLTFLRLPPYFATLTQIAVGIGMTKPGVLKILKTFEEHSFVHKNPVSKLYSLGPALLRLGNVYREEKGISDIAQPVLRQLCDETGVTAYVTLWEKEEAFLLFLEESARGPCYALKSGAVFGDPIPIHSGASAKLLAAHQDPALIAEILDKLGQRRMGPRTITDRESLLREFETIRENGYAQSEDEYEDGLVALSVPIRESSGAVNWALSISGYTAWVSREELLGFLPLLRRGAEQIVHKLSFRH